MVLVTRRLCVAFGWWKVVGDISRGSRLGPVLHRQVISVDAFLKGLGALHKGRGTSERWGVLGQGQHIINVLELRAIHLALWHFLLRLQGHHVFVRTNNTTVAAYDI